MISPEYLNISKITTDSKILKLFKIIENNGGVLRFVGGCVRDAIMEIKGFDFDLATDLSPDELVEICKENSIKTVPIGIKYGTVGVIINDNVLEVTSLRKDITTDGRHAVVEFTDDWSVDASRRDLTINAVYADEKGNVFDYYDGIKDLENGVVKFIGDPEKRIKEDYLRILRFFRFYSFFSKGKMDEKSFKACIKNKEGLRILSEERIQSEIVKILLSPKVVETLKIMFDNELLSFFLPLPKNLESLEFLTSWFDDRSIGNAGMRRFIILYNPDENLAEHLANMQKFSNKNRAYLLRFVRTKISLDELLDEKNLAKLVYKYGKNLCIDKLIANACFENRKISEIENKIKNISEMLLPIFPISGKDIIARGISGSKIGETIDRLENIWIDSNFVNTNEELLKLV